MSARKFLRFQCHEFDGHFHLVRDGLKPYYALTDVRKNHDWTNNGKPSGTFESGGETWRVCLDYDEQPILPWDDSSSKLETAYLYRLYFVCEDETYDVERADQSQRVKGGTITFRPRWPDMKRREKADTDDDGQWTGPVKDVNGYTDLGVPYVDAQVQGSNVEFDRYSSLLADAAATFRIPRRYFGEFYQTSKRERQLEDQVGADDCDLDPEEIDLEEAWEQFTDGDERVNYSTLRIIVSRVANDVDHALEALRKRDVSSPNQVAASRSRPDSAALDSGDTIPFLIFIVSY